MRSQSSGQGVLKQIKQTNAYAPSMAQTNLHAEQSSSSSPQQQHQHQQNQQHQDDDVLSNVIVDPNLDSGGHSSLQAIQDGLQSSGGGHSNVVTGAEEGEDQAYSTNFLHSLPYRTTTSPLRSAYSFVNGGLGPSAVLGSLGAPGLETDGDGRSQTGSPGAALRSDLLLEESPPPDHDTFEGQYRSLRLPPILQVEKQHVTTTATQAASATRRKNEAVFKCPVPGCGSTFTRRFNLRGHLRSHTEERPFVCEWPGCGKGFARSHDCKRHTALHTAKSGTHVCVGCGKTFSRTDALNRHLKSEVGAPCREIVAEAQSNANRQTSNPPIMGGPSETPSLSLDSDATLRPVPFATS